MRATTPWTPEAPSPVPVFVRSSVLADVAVSRRDEVRKDVVERRRGERTGRWLCPWHGGAANTAQGASAGTKCGECRHHVTNEIITPSDLRHHLCLEMNRQNAGNIN